MAGWMLWQELLWNPKSDLCEMKKLCFVVTIPAGVYFLRDFIRASAESWSVNIISSPDSAELLGDLDAQFIQITIERKPSLWRDLFALGRQCGMSFPRKIVFQG